MAIKTKEIAKKINLELNKINADKSQIDIDFDNELAKKIDELIAIKITFHESDDLENEKDKNQKIENEYESQKLINNANSKSVSSSKVKYNLNTLKYISSFLKTSDLVKFNEVSKDFKNASSMEMAVLKKSSELLHHVFQADPLNIIRNLNDPHVKINSILTKIFYREGYYSNKLNQFVLFRFWSDVSPLQAAAYCGDNFLLRKLLSYIINQEIQTKDSSLRLKAVEQLQEVLKSKKYLISFNELIKSYEDFFSHLKDKKCYDIDNLWKKVCECQKRLSRYGLQEFFDSKPFDPKPTFDTEPDRYKLLGLSFNVKLGGFQLIQFNLDLIGHETSNGLHKDIFEQGGICEIGVDMKTAILLSNVTHWNGLKGNLAALNHLCKVRKEELEIIIKCLHNFEEAFSLITLNKETHQKQKP